MIDIKKVHGMKKCYDGSYKCISCGSSKGGLHLYTHADKDGFPIKVCRCLNCGRYISIKEIKF